MLAHCTEIVRALAVQCQSNLENFKLVGSRGCKAGRWEILRRKKKIGEVLLEIVAKEMCIALLSH